MYEKMTDDFLRERMLARVSDKLDKRPSALIYDTHEAAANELAILYVELEYLLKNSYGDSASREFLVLLCRDRGIIPDPATKAVLRGIFVPDKVVGAGQRFNIGEMNYVFTGKRVEDEKGGWEVQCEKAGTEGNKYLGSMIPMDYVAGLERAELTEVLIPGRDEEDTEELRKRYFDSFDERAFGGNRADYLSKVRGMEGIGGVKVARIWNGDLRPAHMIPAKEVREWYTSAIGTLPKEAASWLSAVYAAGCEKKLTVGGTVLVTVVGSEDFGEVSNVLLQRVQTALDPEENAGEGYGLAPIGHVVRVRSAEPVGIEVQTRIIFEEGYGWSGLSAAIGEAVDAYLLELRQGWAQRTSTAVRISQIESRILAVKGVADVADTRLNGAAENLILGEYQIPVKGDIAFSPWKC